MTTHSFSTKWRTERAGLLWPAMDVKCAQVVFDMSRDLELVMKYVDGMGARPSRSCIQAGGNCGVWPRALAAHFAQVYTAEPHPLNFVALTVNTADMLNVIRLQVAFGFDRVTVGTALAAHETDNCGAFFVTPGKGAIPTIRIDDLAIPDCALIYLDIEGFELEALRGAEYTIGRGRPVIVLEDKGLSTRYGTEIGQAGEWIMKTFPYRQAARIHRDVVLVPV